MKGVLLIDKPAGMTSHDVVDRIRHAAHTRRVGHTGTLDPSATGLLIICVGEATRLSEYLTRLDKVYEGYLRFGVVTDSYDMDGKVLEENPVPELDPDAIQRAFDPFSGDIEQVPPMVSAVKVGGKRLYKLARKGETVERKPRKVTVKEFRLLGYEAPLAQFRVECTSGTYVRALCQDVGQSIGCGATLDSLRRVAVGRHRVENAVPVNDFRNEEDIYEHMMAMGEALDLPEVVVRPKGEHLVASGGALRRAELKSDCPVTEGWIQIKSERGELLALAQVEKGPAELQVLPRRVFAGRR